jgi:hypothetical protein
MQVQLLYLLLLYRRCREEQRQLFGICRGVSRRDYSIAGRCGPIRRRERERYQGLVPARLAITLGHSDGHAGTPVCRD